MATAAAGDAAPAGGGKKKLVIIVVAVLVLALVGVAALLLLKKKPAEDEDGESAAPAAAHHAEVKPGTPPVFVPLEPFTVNLADKEVDRFAQIGITLEVADAKFAEQLKLYMPAIRSNVLMVLSHKTSVELLTLEGKEKLARDIMRESLRPMGIEIDDEDDEGTTTKKRKKKRAVVSPISNVLFSSFIVQ
ncbi:MULTISPECIES: flagellar basal body-associated FliL family protein [unclassified Roseateles]|uniref:flagellar basal body-associated FliL family protein n=1 Tax=unclassified Roseateles TaxID=2626991 RepID=UPI0010F6FDE0|nr:MULTISPECIES: flagellar basal body-associated FliL family protein [unclassified Roseateles]MCZ7884011.1 flagellar basal body-associated FliL family protein [Paucibacter sp. M5-1]MDC6170731.1 flagellar basal body-associated FliL family protein [Paucibacter sp. XJ19-41]